MIKEYILVQYLFNMTVFESLEFSKWLPIILILVFIITILGLSYWYLIRRRQNKKNFEKEIKRFKPINNLSSPNHNLTKKSLSLSSSQLTNTDIAYLDKLVRTASDRSMWKRDYSKKDQYNKLRKIPSRQIQEKS
jgi:hypothetical protein